MNPLYEGAISTHEKELSFLASKGDMLTEAALQSLIILSSNVDSTKYFNILKHFYIT